MDEELAQTLINLKEEHSQASIQALTRSIRKSIFELAFGKKQKVFLLIDEAPLLRLEVFAELHTWMQFGGDSKPLLSMIPGRTE